MKKLYIRVIYSDIMPLELEVGSYEEANALATFALSQGLSYQIIEKDAWLFLTDVLL